MDRQQMLQKINSCGQCKELNNGSILPCDTHWQEMQPLINKPTPFDEWLKKRGFIKESNERYTIERVYLYELYERVIKPKK
jgi:hypothetical protein